MRTALAVQRAYWLPRGGHGAGPEPRAGLRPLPRLGRARDRGVRADRAHHGGIGPYDLSVSPGRPGDWCDPEVQAAPAEVGRVVRLGRKAEGHHVVRSGRAEHDARLAAGCTFIVYGDDMVFFAEKAREEHGYAGERRGRGA